MQSPVQTVTFQKKLHWRCFEPLINQSNFCICSFIAAGINVSKPIYATSIEPDPTATTSSVTTVTAARYVYSKYAPFCRAAITATAKVTHWRVRRHLIHIEPKTKFTLTSKKKNARFNCIANYGVKWLAISSRDFDFYSNGVDAGSKHTAVLAETSKQIPGSANSSDYDKSGEIIMTAFGSIHSAIVDCH